jgi:hypothetical protein
MSRSRTAAHSKSVKGVLRCASSAQRASASELSGRDWGCAVMSELSSFPPEGLEQFDSADGLDWVPEHDRLDRGRDRCDVHGFSLTPAFVSLARRNNGAINLQQDGLTNPS